jgi:restriction system protein
MLCGVARTKQRTEPPSRPANRGLASICVAAAGVLISASGLAQSSAVSYYHVEEITTGCQSAGAVRILADQQALAQANPQRIKSVRASGHCVTITPRSNWTFLWRENDVAMMAYSGASSGRDGRPGSYYLMADQLIDAQGQHPADPAVKGGVSVTTVPAPPQTSPASPPAPQAVEPAVAPKYPLPSAASSAAFLDGMSNHPIAADNPRAPMDSTEDLLAEALGYVSSISATAWVLVGMVVLAVLALAGFALMRLQGNRSGNYEEALAIAMAEIRSQAGALHAAKLESARPDRYGTFHNDGWAREKQLFVANRIVPKLHAAGYAALLGPLSRSIDADIERHANSSFTDAPASPFWPAERPLESAPLPSPDPDLPVDALEYGQQCASLLRDAGWTTESTPVCNSQDIDIWAERDGRTFLLICKSTTIPIGIDAVERACAELDERHADLAAIVSNAPFTRAARQMASARGLRALNQNDLPQLAA